MPTRFRSQSCCVSAGLAAKSCGCKFNDLELCNCLTCGRTHALAHSQRARPFRAQPLGGGLFMRGRTRATLAAGLTTIALVATACGGGGTPTPATSEGGQAGGEITVAGCTPKNALIPGNTSETCGGDIIDAMTAKLVEYNTENAAPEIDIAESIETSDNKKFTVKLKPATSSRTAPTSRRRTSSTPGTTRPTDPMAMRAATSTSRSPATPTCSAPTRTASRSPRPRPCPG